MKKKPGGKRKICVTGANTEFYFAGVCQRCLGYGKVSQTTLETDYKTGELRILGRWIPCPVCRPRGRPSQAEVQKRIQETKELIAEIEAKIRGGETGEHEPEGEN